MFASHCDARGVRGRLTTSLSLTALILFGTVFLPGPAAAAIYPGALIPTTSHPTSMAAGDYNADGATDFAVLNYATNTVSILLASTTGGVGNGSFQEAFTFAVGEEPWDIASGDLDGDGYLELAVTEGLGNQLSIWRPFKPGGVPDGTFWQGQVKGTWQYPVRVKIFDYSGDGLNDIVVANYWSDNIILYRGDGTGNVSADGVLEVGARPIDLAVGDFNGDAEPDLAVVNLLSDDASIFLGQAGSDALAPAGNYAAGPRPVHAAVGTLVDGKDDLVFANYYDDDLSFVLSTDAAQSQGQLFEEPQRFLEADRLAGGAPRWVELVDFEEDGNLDLLIALEARDQLVTVRGFLGTSFIQPKYFHAGFRPIRAMATLIDDDPYLDVVALTHWTHGLLVLNGIPNNLGQPTTSFAPVNVDMGSRGPVRTLLLDLNGDGFEELLVLGDGFGDVTVRRGAAAPFYFSGATERVDIGPEPTSIAYGQLSTDNLPDLVTVDARNDICAILQANPNSVSFLRPPVGLPVSANPQDVVTGDFDRDGDADIMVLGADEGRIDLIRVDKQSIIGANSFQPAISFAVAGSDANDNPARVLTGTVPAAESGSSFAFGGDVNNDQRMDYAIGSPGEGIVRVYYGADVLTDIPDLVLTGVAAERFGEAVAFGDIDNDGIDDILVGAPLNDDLAQDGGIVFVFRGGDDSNPDLGVGGAQAGENFGTRIVSGADLNGDDHDDWVASSPYYDGTGADAGRVYLFWGNGLDGASDLRIDGAFGGDLCGDALGISQDFTADGRPDLLVGLPGASSETFEKCGRIQVHAGGSNISADPVMFAAGSGDTAALGSSIAGIGDYNGDGIGDIAAGAPSFDTETLQNRGQVSIWYGGPIPDDLPDYVRSGRQTGGRLGASVAPAGDVRQSGTPAFLVGEPGYFDERGVVPEYGRVHMIEGGTTPNENPMITMAGGVLGGLFGTSVAGGADIDGDGYSDWIAGAPFEDTGGDEAGSAYVYRGGRGGIPGLGALATGDFNQDGAVDLVAVNQSSNEVCIFLNDASQIFVDPDRPASEIFLVDGAPSAIATADFDSDGADDLVIVRSDFEDLVIYRCNGDGTFSLNQSLPIGPQLTGFDLAPRRLYIGDYTDNGTLDLATVLSAWGAVSIREGEGGFNFGGLGLYAAAAQACDVSFADVTDDGKLDMVMGDIVNSTVSIHYHQGGDTVKQLATEAPATPPRIAPLLAQNYPNPFNPKTLIRFDLPVGGRVSLEVFDVRGRKVATLVDQEMESGPQQTEWTGRDDEGSEVAAGVYLYRLEIDGEDMGRRKMVLAK